MEKIEKTAPIVKYLGQQKEYSLEFTEKPINVISRVYPGRDLIRCLVLEENQYFEAKFSLKTGELASCDLNKYRRPIHKKKNASKFRIGSFALDKNFRKMDYTVYENMFDIMDCAYFREFYILYNEYGTALASGRKKKLLVKWVLPPFKTIAANFMDKEENDILFMEIKCGLSAKLGLLKMRLQALRSQLGNRNQGGAKSKAPEYKCQIFSTHQRKVIKEFELHELLGVEQDDIKRSDDIVTFGSLIALPFHGYLNFFKFCSTTLEFERIEEFELKFGDRSILIKFVDENYILSYDRAKLQYQLIDYKNQSLILISKNVETVYHVWNEKEIFYISYKSKTRGYKLGSFILTDQPDLEENTVEPTDLEDNPTQPIEQRGAIATLDL